MVSVRAPERLPDTMSYRDVVSTNFELLLRCLDPNPVFLHGLRSVDYFRRRLAAVHELKTMDRQNDVLLRMVLDVPDDMEHQVTIQPCLASSSFSKIQSDNTEAIIVTIYISQINSFVLHGEPLACILFQFLRRTSILHSPTPFPFPDPGIGLLARFVRAWSYQSLVS